MNVDRINKNHIVNNLVEAYLKQNPGKYKRTSHYHTPTINGSTTQFSFTIGVRKEVRNSNEKGAPCFCRIVQLKDSLPKKKKKKKKHRIDSVIRTYFPLHQVSSSTTLF